ncbi:acyl carrier protein [Paenibacillus sp. L3-i20]|uniref:acyl carrier protein n=1 Tax=Paenibacillus sp. L3-i20 TaxID=2905833 RepID=UPI001EDF63B0|nr:acyl carrier protein [Paenibacillus sp. L3-i20]GKU79389.1 hypothetical protein L3i20_v237860 [Paenibacillus sp. L3-i20]
MLNVLEQNLLSEFAELNVTILKSEYDEQLEDLWGIDSISYVQILASLQKALHFVITDEDYMTLKLNTFNNLLYLLETKTEIVK